MSANCIQTDSREDNIGTSGSSVIGKWRSVKLEWFRLDRRLEVTGIRHTRGDRADADISVGLLPSNGQSQHVGQGDQRAHALYLLQQRGLRIAHQECGWKGGDSGNSAEEKPCLGIGTGEDPT